MRGDGYIWARGQLINSDYRIKKDIKSLYGDKNLLGGLFRLEAVAYRYDETFKSENLKDYTPTEEKATNKKYSEDSVDNFESPINYGFIAQEVKAIFPELVDEDENGLLSINYIAIIPLLVEALKDQQQQIDELKTKINKNNANNSSPKASETSFSSLEGGISVASLKQNIPNPFNNDTQIGYFLPENISNATLYIYDMQGNQLKSFQIRTRGHGSQTILASELTSGIYLYTLVADGKEVDTKRMILTK